MKKTLFALILGLIWKISLAQVAPFTCNPDEDCAAIGKAGALVPDPNDCERFYVCIDVSGEIVPSISSVQCPVGEYFDQSLRSCRLEDTPGTCGPNVCISNICISTCPSPFGNITSVANKLDCSTYYVCLSSGPILVSCSPSTPYFSGTTCVTDASECCDFCTAYCTTPGIEIVDPCDCTSYYICFNAGNALPNFRFTCDSGTYFDETTATCLTGSCTPICSNCGTENPTTSSAGATAPSADTTTTPLATTTTPLAVTTTLGIGCQSLETFTCPRDGNYPVCPYCVREYFHCYNGVATVGKCSANYQFNPVPEYPYCLDPNNCPYSLFYIN